MNKQQLEDFVHSVCERYSYQWNEYNRGALESVVEMEAKNNGYQLQGEPLNSIMRMCAVDLRTVYKIL